MAFTRSGALFGIAGPRSRARGAIGGTLFAFGAVGIEFVVTFGDTLNARLRGPEGALGGGGVFGREDMGWGALKLSDCDCDCGEANVIRGDAAGCAGYGREALGPVGAEMSEARCITGDCGWLVLFENRPLLTFGDDGTAGGAPFCRLEASVRLCVALTSLPEVPSHDLELCNL